MAGNRFRSDYPCSDQGKICVSSGMRVVDGFEVSRPCWQWSYVKTCQYPSKNDCRLYEHCYDLGTKECLLKDSLGNCVNHKKEFSCKSWEATQKENKEARIDLVEKDGPTGLVCTGVPCIDGNCVDKSYLTNGEMMDAVSKLHAASNMQPDKDHNFNLFAGFSSHCSKKPAGFSNCCPGTVKGWGKHLGAICTKDEISLINLREKKLCVYVGKKSSGTKPFHVNKHYFCCFGNTLERIIQVEGRKQLGLNFGSDGNPDCRGLTIEEITGYDKYGNERGKGLDFSKMDFSDFIKELMVKFTGTYKTPNPQEIADRIKAHMNIKKYDDNENNPDNKFAGLNQNIKDDSWEAEEERRIEAERREQERLATIEAERLEQARLAKLGAKKLEKERLARIEQERRAKEQRKARAKQRIEQIWKEHDINEKKIKIAERKYQEAVDYWNRVGSKRSGRAYEDEWQKVKILDDRQRELWQVRHDLHAEARKLDREAR